MPSSTSSSEPRALGVAWLLAVVLAAVVLFALDRHGRGLGMPAGLIDSMQLWSIQRDRVYGDAPRPAVFIGASRSAYGIDPKTWRSLVPDSKPVMLSLNGRHPIAVLRDLGLADDDARVNPNGGAIAMGHPLGMSGARLVTTALYELHRRGGRYALCTMCIGVGQGIAMIIERV